MNDLKVEDSNQPSSWLVVLAVALILVFVWGLLKFAEPYKQTKKLTVLHGEQVFGSDRDTATDVQVEFEQSKFFYGGSVYVTSSGGDQFWLSTPMSFSTVMSDYESQRGEVEFCLFDHNSLRQVVTVSVADLRKVQRMSVGRPCIAGGWMKYDGGGNDVQLVCFFPTIQSRCRFLCEEKTQ